MSEKIEPVAEEFHDRLYGLTFKLFLNPNEDTPNNEIRLVLGATVGSGDSEVAYFHAEQGVLHDAATVSALEARVKELEDRCMMLSAQANEESRRANGAEWRVEGLRDGLLGVESILGPVVKLGDTTSDAAKALEAAGAALNKDQP